MIRIEATQRVVEDVGRERRLPPGLAFARKVSLDQTGNDGNVAKGPFHHGIS